MSRRPASRFGLTLFLSTALALGGPAAATSSSGAPVVHAGGDTIALLGSAGAELAGLAFHPQGIAEVRWQQVGGPLAELGSPHELVTSITPRAAGLHVFRLGVTSTTGLHAWDTVQTFVLGAGGGGEVEGARRKWHGMTVSFRHDRVQSEEDPDNPFRNYRLVTYFLHPESGTFHTVPGYFAADGDAANTSATAGDVWRVHFTPDRAGDWLYLASFRTGPDVAIDLDPTAGTRVSFDGQGGYFRVRPADVDAPGFASKGRLSYVGERYYRFAETGERFLKSGAGSPENLLGYFEFDDTFDLGGVSNGLSNGGYFDGLHHFDPHLGDFATLGGPLWKGQFGRGINGALNYLASEGVNSLYFLTYNSDGGDGQEVWPWVRFFDRTRFDVSKLAQWQIVLDRLGDLGIAQHLVMQETENDHSLDGGQLGIERKLYYRELIARFGHSLALVWNLGEEITNADEHRREFAAWIRAVDPWNHPIVVHTNPGDVDSIYDSLLGFSFVEGPSLQLDPVDVAWRTSDYIARSAAAGKQWVVTYDEQNPAEHGVVPDSVDAGHDDVRRRGLWGNLMAGGAGADWYFGYEHPNDDLDCEDFRSRNVMWDQTRHAVSFLQSRLRFWTMSAADHLTPWIGDQVLAKPGQAYAVFVPDGRATELDLGGFGRTFAVAWLNPRTGTLVPGSPSTVSGPGLVSLGAAPSRSDWCALVRVVTPMKPVVDEFDRDPTTPLFGGGPVNIRIRAWDPNGAQDIDRVELYLIAPNGSFAGFAPVPHYGGELWAVQLDDEPALSPGTWTWIAAAWDKTGRVGFRVGEYVAP